MTGGATCDSNMSVEENHRRYKEAMKSWREYYKKRRKNNEQQAIDQYAKTLPFYTRIGTTIYLHDDTLIDTLRRENNERLV
jgi:hypothetical protein